MKAVTEENPVIKLVPRYYPASGDNLILTFEDGFEIDFTWIQNKNVIEITLLDTSEFIQGSDYAFTLYSEQNLIYKGVIIFLKNGTDIQNYETQSQDTSRWK